jgi:DNA invertase Pin-like site-specific DNA recombinase
VSRPKVVAAYERVSGIMGREDEAFRSPEMQHKPNVAVIKAAGHIVYADPSGARFCDVDRTGLDFHREHITRGRKLKQQGVIDGIATLDVSRVGRTPPETLQVIDDFRADGGVYLSTYERIDETPQGEFMLGIFVHMAALYSNNIAQGWRAAITARTEGGEHNGPAPLGYRREKLDSGRTRVVIDPVTSPAIVDAFQRYADGQSATSIEARLQRQEVIA